MKVFEAAKPGQPLTQVSEKSLELKIDREHPEGAFSDPSMDTQEMDRVRLARSPKDTDKGAFEGQETQSARCRRGPKDDFAKPYIPEGPYRARYQGHTYYSGFKTPKLKLDFIIVTEGPQFGVAVQRHYTVKRSGKKGWKPLTWTCSLVREWFLCHPDSPRNMRWDRVPMTRWFESEYQIIVGTVRKDFQQRDLTDQQIYSKVKEIIGRA